MTHVTNSKYLGITFSSDLHWNLHISTITSKANQTLGFLRRNLKGCPRELKQLAFFSLVRSKLEYASVVWDPHLEKDKQLLDKVQRRGARFVMDRYKNDQSVSSMLETLQWTNLEERRSRGRICMLDKIVKGKVAIKEEDYITRSNTRTRSTNSIKFITIGTKTNPYKYSFFSRTIPSWNNTPDETVEEYGAGSAGPVQLY